MIAFKNELTGEMKQVKIGFSWVLLLLGFFGMLIAIPLFMRKLIGWGIAMLLGWLGVGVLSIIEPVISAILGLIMFGLWIYLAICGNKLTAYNYIKLGYKVAETDPTRIELVKRAWGLPDSAFITKEK